jgi:hypothetical protein
MSIFVGYEVLRVVEYEKLYLLGCNVMAVLSAFCLLHAGFLLVLLSDPEDGGNMIIQNVS